MVSGLHFILEKGLSNFLWSVFLHFVKLLKVEGSHKLAYNGKALAMAGHLKIVCPARSRIELLMMKI